MNATLRGLWKDRRVFLYCRLSCAIIWALEWFWAQGIGFAAPPWTHHPVLIPLVRFIMDLILAVGFCVMVPRRVLLVLMVGNFAVLALMATYTAFFHRPLMALNAWYQWRDAWEVRGSFFEIVSWPIVAVAALCLAIKLQLLLSSGRLMLTRIVRLRGWLMVLGLYLLPAGLLQFSSFKINMMKGGATRHVYAYGYAIPWLFDIYANHKIQSHRAQAMACLAEQYDRLTPVERLIPIESHVAILQLESVGTSAIDARYKGELVMPFVHSLKEQGLYFRIESFHFNGSCDMDYAATTFVRPYHNLNPYRIKDLPYTNSMPAFMKNHGYSNFFFHGNTGKFYDRETVVEKLGFDRIYFKEQLHEKNLAASPIGIRDGEMFDQVSSVFQTSQRTFAMLITLDTHTPFNFLHPIEAELFTVAANAVERYFNSLRYLDRCLEKFINGLPEGTTVVIYGDHTASLRSGMFNSDIVAGREYVGCLIYQKGADLSRQQKTRHLPVAVSGKLNLLDMLSYVRNCIAASNEATVKNESLPIAGPKR